MSKKGEEPDFNIKLLLKKFLNPNMILKIFIWVSAIILLVCVFNYNLEGYSIAYFAYLYSTYALIIFMIWLVKFCKFAKTYIKENSEIYKVYEKNYKLISKYILIIGLTINFVYGIFKLSTGIYYKSVWFMTLAIYYLMLCFIKIGLVRNYENNIGKQYRKMKHTGITLLLMNIILFGIIMLIIHTNQTFYYPGYLIYIVAIYDFYLIFSAFISIIKYRKRKEPIILASKTVSLTVAMVSMISLEIAMVYTFGGNEAEFKSLMTGILGFVVIFINSFMAIMLIKKSKMVELFLE